MDYIGTNDTLSDFKNLTKNFIDVTNWLESLDIVTSKGRINDYKIFLDSIDETEKSHLLSLFFSNMYREIYELIWVYKNHSKFKPSINLNFIKSTLKGVTTINLEKTADQSSRNYLFELRVASYYINCGYDIKLDDVTDLIVSKDGMKYYIECKRISSVKQIPIRIKEASRQLDKRLQPNELKNTYGLIWIDLSFVQVGFRGFYSTYFRKNSQLVARLELMEIMQNSIPDFAMDNRIIGIYSQTLYPGISSNPKGYFTGSTINVQPLTKTWKKIRHLKKITSELLKNYG